MFSIRFDGGCDISHKYIILQQGSSPKPYVINNLSTTPENYFVDSTSIVCRPINRFNDKMKITQIKTPFIIIVGHTT